MEKRAIVAALLIGALFILAQELGIFGAPSPPPPQTASDPAKPASGSGAPAATGSAQPGAPAMPAPVTPAGPATAPTGRQAEIQTPLYRARLSTAGGAFQDWTLLFRGEKPMVLPGVLGPSGLIVRRVGQETPLGFDLSADRLVLGTDRPEGELILTGDDGYGLRVIQTFRFRADTYVVDQTIRVENRHTVAQGAELALGWAGPVEWPKEQEAFRGTRPIHVVRLDPDAFWAYREYPSATESFSGRAVWVGFEEGLAPVGQSGVFLTALVPRSPELAVTHARQKGGDGPKAPEHVSIGLVAKLPVLQPGQSWEGRFQTYLGPMEYARLKALGVHLERAIYFGGFPFSETWARRYGMPTLPMEWIAVPTLSLMHWFHRFLANYGLAIILLTVITKVLFFPLSLKSMRSMKAMQALQPQVNALRAKYRNDPQRLQRETMELYRQHRVNPLGGCLPMVVQIPIFYALYVALTVSADLQSAPFVCFGRAPSWLPFVGGQDLWICDLSAQDPTYVLPILMGVSMFIQQKMTPVVGDPRQAKIMLMMPILFTFMFLNLPSGLVLYWTLSNVLQIGQQWYMDRDKRAAAKAPARAAKKA